MMKATMIGLMAIALGLLAAPNAVSGSGCGSSNGGQSDSHGIATEVSGNDEANQDNIELEELSRLLAGNIADLENRLSGIIDGIEEGRLRAELVGAEQVVIRLRTDIVNYQVLALRMLALTGQDGADYSETAAVEPKGCGH